MKIYQTITCAISALTILASCGGGSGASAPSLPQPAPTPTYTVSTNSSLGGQISAASKVVSEGKTAEFTLTADANYSLDSVNGCGGTLTNNIYVTASVSANCTVSASFVYVNQAPVVTTQKQLSVDEFSKVTLVADGTDPDGSITAYSWTQTSGIDLTIEDKSTASISFNIPAILQNENFEFLVTVTDNNGAQASTNIVVTAQHTNIAPTVVLQNEITVIENTSLALTALGSDIDGQIVAYEWTQIAGDTLNVTSNGNNVLNIEIPKVTKQTQVIFQVEVTDTNGDIAQSTSTITIIKDSQAPNSVILVGATALSSSKISVDWLETTDNHIQSSKIKYNVHVSNQSRFLPALGNSKLTLTGQSTAEIDGLLPNTLYYLLISAEDDNGNLSYSNELRVATMASEPIVSQKHVLKYVNTAVVTPNSMVYTLSTNEIAPQIGEVIVSTSQNGMLRKVTAVSVINNVVSLQTEPAALNELYENVDINTTIKLIDLSDPLGTSIVKKNKTAVNFSQKSLPNTGQVRNLQWQDSHLSISHSKPTETQVRSIAKSTAASTQASSLASPASHTIQDKHLLLSGPRRIAFTPGILNTLNIDALLINDPEGALEVSELELIGLSHNAILPNEDNYTARAITVVSSASIDPQYLNTENISNRRLKFEWTPSIRHIDTLTSQPYIATFRAKVVERNCSASCSQSTATLQVKIEVGNSELSSRTAVTFENSDEITIKGLGYYAFEPTVNVRAKIENSQLSAALATVKGHLDFQVDVDLIAEKSGNTKVQTQLIQKSFTKQLSVGGVPVFIRGEFTLNGEFSGAANEPLNISQSFDLGVFIEAGFEYKDGQWEKIFTGTPNLSYRLTSGANSQALTNLTLKPELKLWIYESNAGHIQIQPSIYSELSLDGEFAGLLDTQVQNELPNNYRFTSLNAGMSNSLQLRANFKAFDQSIAPWPSENTNQLKDFVVLERASSYGIPSVFVQEVPAMAPTNSCLINANAQISPLLATFGSANTFNNWESGGAKWTLSLSDNASTSKANTGVSNGNDVAATFFDVSSDVEILATKFSEYHLRFSGFSEIGSWAKQYQDIYFDFRDLNNDSLPDYWASKYNVSVANEDADNDGITNANEFLNCTFPNNSDSDLDGMPDGWEVAHSLNPNFNDANEDTDTDTRTNLQEFLDNSNPQLIDINEPPIATIDQDQTVEEFSTVQIIGSASDGGSISKVLWTQLSGPLIGLSNTNNLVLSFVAPQVDETTVLGFELEVTDNSGAQDSAQVLITVNPVNDKPSANAGTDLIVSSGELATLDASSSTDTDGSIVSYEWRVNNGQALPIDNPNSAQTSFVAPEVVVTSVFEISLKVVDDDGAFDISVINVTVKPIVDAPVLLSLNLARLTNTVVVFRGLNNENMDTTIALFLNETESKIHIAQDQLDANNNDIVTTVLSSSLMWDVTDNTLNIQSASLSDLQLQESLSLTFSDGKIDLYENPFGDAFEVAELYKVKSLSSTSLEGYRFTLLQNTENRVIDFVTHNRVFSYAQLSQNIESGEWLYSDTGQGMSLELSMASGESFSARYQSFTTGASIFDSLIVDISVLPEIEDPLALVVFADDKLRECVQSAAINNNWLSKNEVTHLDCSSMNIQSSQGLQALSNLVSLNLSNNALHTVNVSQQSELRELNLSDNQLYSLDLNFNPKLETVTLNNNDFSSAAITYLSSIAWIDHLFFDEVITLPGGSDFVMRLTINDSQSFRIITNENFTYDYSVDWGDGTVTANHSEDSENTYLEAGVYEITISGDYPAFKFCESNDGCSGFKLDILHWGSNKWRSMESAFSGLHAITILAQDKPDISLTSNFSFMFYKTPNFNSDISDWDTSNITDMNFMFGFASSFNGDISRWDTSSVTNMGGLFYFATSFNSDISQWNTSAVTKMHSLFAFANKFNTDLSQWNTSSVTYMATMFLGASNFNGNVSNWDVSKVYNMNKMFYNATSMTGDLRTWNVATSVAHSNFTHADSLLIEPIW